MSIINESSGVSPFRQVAGALRTEIQSGELKVGERLPSARELAERYGVALTTVVRATEELRKEGLVQTERGRGSFVKALPTLVRQGEQRYRRMNTPIPGTQLTARTGRTTATSEIADRLNVEIGDELTVVHYFWTTNTDGQPLQQSTQWEPSRLTSGTAIEVPDTSGEQTVIMRFDSIGIRVDKVIEEVRTRMPSTAESATLEIVAGIPVFELRRTHWASELAVETASIVIRGDRVVISTVHDVPDAE